MTRLIRAGAEVCPVSVPVKAQITRYGSLFAVAMALGLGLGGCSPALNWRDVTLGNIALTLPCKPDHAQRKVSLGGESLEMDMVGCEADGALFAVSRLGLPKALSADQLQAHWQTATLQQMKAQGDPVLAPAGTRANALALRKLNASGQATDGRAIQARLAWVAAGPDVYHFAVYAARITPEMAEPFFDGAKAR
jgi:hypothetical protein